MLEKILRRSIICGIFTIPFIALVIDHSMFYPAITSKNFAFRIAIEVIGGLWLALALVHQKYRPQHSIILKTFAFLLLVTAIANFLGVDPYRSFWSNYGRMDGWITLLHIFIYFLVLSSIITTEKLWRLFFHVSLGVSVLVSIYGFLQIIGFLPIETRGGGRSFRAY